MRSERARRLLLHPTEGRLPRGPEGSLPGGLIFLARATLAYSGFPGPFEHSEVFKVHMVSRASVGTDSLRVEWGLPGALNFSLGVTLRIPEKTLRAPRAGLGLLRAGGRGPLGRYQPAFGYLLILWGTLRAREGLERLSLGCHNARGNRTLVLWHALYYSIPFSVGKSAFLLNRGLADSLTF